MQTPFLFDRQRMLELRDDPEKFHEASLRQFGTTAESHQKGLKEWVGPSKTQSVWQRALAAEALLFPPGNQRDNAPFTFMTEDVHPWGDSDLPYSVLKNHPVAAALFPMCSENGSARIGRIWAVKASADGKMPPISKKQFPLDGAQELFEMAKQECIRLYADVADYKVRGPSWQLAAFLAIKVLFEDDLNLRIRLASEWMITGEISIADRKVKYVEIGNKPFAAGNSNRHWLIPALSATGFQSECELSGFLPYTLAATVDEAFARVKGYVGRRRQDEELPARLGVLHILVGTEPELVLKTLKYVCPGKLYLWPLEIAGDIKNLKKAIHNEYPELLVLKRAYLPGDDLIKAGEILKSFFDNQGAHKADGMTFFNITGSTCLVQMAVEAQARLHGFHLICQEPSCKKFVKVWFENGIPQFCRLRINRKHPNLDLLADRR